MATLRQRYINTAADGTGNGTTNATTGANGAYKSFHAGLAAEYAVTPDLVAADILLKFNAEGVAGDSVAVSFSSYQFVTNANCYVWLYVDPSVRHPGYYSTNHYRLVRNDTQIINSINCKVVLEGVQVVNSRNASSSPNGIVLSSGGTGDLTCVKCVLHESGTPGGGASGAAVFGSGTSARKVKLINTVISGGWYRGVQVAFVAAGGQVLLYHNTIVGTDNDGVLTNNNTAGTTYFKNNRIAAPVTGGTCFDYGSTTLAGSAGNYTGDASSPEGAAFQNKTFTWADAGSFDYHIVSGDAFTGSDLSADAIYPVSDDIDGEVRSSTPFAGADEFSAGGPSFNDFLAVVFDSGGGGSGEGAGVPIGGWRIR